ncbi:hypothetical protein AAG906_007822 [Vitis piasezkii]
MVKDCMEYEKKCQSCQFHSNFIHQPPEPLYPTIASWLFDAWGLDVVGPITPKSSAGHAYILATTNYFSKWAEIVPLKEVKKEIVYIITDNGKPFYNKLMSNLYERFSFKQHNSSMYNAPTNGLAKAFNKTLCNLLNKIIPSLRIVIHEGLTDEDNAKLHLQE